MIVLVPDDFFDRVVEDDKQYLDYASAVVAANSPEGLEQLTSFKVLPSSKSASPILSVNSR